MNFNPKVTAYISQATPEQIELLETLRQLIHENVPETTEEIKWNIPVFAKTKDYTYLRFAKKHITFGFYNTDKIEDPDNILEGSGKTLKHIKIRVLEDIDKALIGKWLKAIAE